MWADQRINDWTRERREATKIWREGNFILHVTQLDRDLNDRANESALRDSLLIVCQKQRTRSKSQCHGESISLLIIHREEFTWVTQLLAYPVCLSPRRARLTINSCLVFKINLCVHDMRKSSNRAYKRSLWKFPLSEKKRIELEYFKCYQLRVKDFELQAIIMARERGQKWESIQLLNTLAFFWR